MHHYQTHNISIPAYGYDLWANKIKAMSTSIAERKARLPTF